MSRRQWEALLPLFSFFFFALGALSSVGLVLWAGLSTADLASAVQAQAWLLANPVLDTLLLSAVVHPQQETDELEAIAQRFGLSVTNRHTSLGDTLLTAQLFLKFIPLLAERGITTLQQAREAAQQTYYARLEY